jgi:hypothetical protein
MQQQRRRSGIILGLVALGLLAGAALTARPAQAVDAIGPYYAEPAWDQKLPVATRFVVLTNWNSAAVLDKETGLVWERSPHITGHIWSAARVQCTARTTGARKGWRLPSVHELASLIDPSVASPGPNLPPGHPFLTVQSALYWSATTYVDDSSIAGLVGFGGGFSATGDRFAAFHAWCVRGGMHAGQY